MKKISKRTSAKANFATHEWLYSCSEVGTYFTVRGSRNYRGNKL